MSSSKNDKLKTTIAEPMWRIEIWFPHIKGAILEKLKAYHVELLKYNKTLNLISSSTIVNADSVHFADCIIVSELITKVYKINQLFDIGSGNGFPGVVMGILNPNIKVVLVENDLRKAEFLKNLIGALQLKNQSVYSKSVETLPEKSIQYAISRGFAPLQKSLLLTRKLFIKGGVYFNVKSEEWPNEVAQIPIQLCSYWYPSLFSDYSIPTIESKFSIVKAEKITE